MPAALGASPSRRSAATPIGPLSFSSRAQLSASCLYAVTIFDLRRPAPVGIADPPLMLLQQQPRPLGIEPRPIGRRLHHQFDPVRVPAPTDRPSAARAPASGTASGRWSGWRWGRRRAVPKVRHRQIDPIRQRQAVDALEHQRQRKAQLQFHQHGGSPGRTATRSQLRTSPFTSYPCASRKAFTGSYNSTSEVTGKTAPSTNVMTTGHSRRLLRSTSGVNRGHAVEISTGPQLFMNSPVAAPLRKGG